MKFEDLLEAPLPPGAFQWSSHLDEDAAKTVNSLVKYNNGVWKSAKQRAFLTSSRGLFNDSPNNLFFRKDYPFLKSNFNVDAEAPQYVIQVEGIMRWADYGAKSVRRVGWMYVMDQFGVVKKYKLGYDYSSDGRSSGIDKSKTKLDWERPKDAKTDHLESQEKDMAAAKDAQSKENASKEHLGEVGKWINDVEVTIKKVADLGPGDYGERYATFMVDSSGNNLVYWGYPKIQGGAEEAAGKKFGLRAKVKKHAFNKEGTKVTYVGYPTFTPPKE
jgi:hypothetical protein